jgi:chromosome segregation ATPase
MAKRKNRTPQERLEELKQQEAKLKAKLASKSLQDRDDTAPLVDALNEARKGITVARRGFSNGPQSFEARIEKHQAWIEKIEAEMQDADSTILRLEAQRDYLSQELEVIAAAVADDPDADYSQAVQNVLNPNTQAMEA